MNGQQLWRAVRREFKKQHPTGTIHRIENTLERGMSDVVWGANGHMGWIELKGEGDRETPIQRAFRNKWNSTGNNAVILSTHNPFYGVGYFVEDSMWVEPYDNLAKAIMQIANCKGLGVCNR